MAAVDPLLHPHELWFFRLPRPGFSILYQRVNAFPRLAWVFTPRHGQLFVPFLVIPLSPGTRLFCRYFFLAPIFRNGCVRPSFSPEFLFYCSPPPAHVCFPSNAWVLSHYPKFPFEMGRPGFSFPHRPVLVAPPRFRLLQISSFAAFILWLCFGFVAVLFFQFFLPLTFFRKMAVAFFPVGLAHGFPISLP